MNVDARQKRFFNRFAIGKIRAKNETRFKQRVRP